MSRIIGLDQCNNDILLMIIKAAGMHCSTALMLTSQRLCAMVHTNMSALMNESVTSDLSSVSPTFYHMFSMKQRICLCNDVAQTLDVALPPLKKEYIVSWHDAFAWITSSKSTAEWFCDHVLSTKIHTLVNCLVYFRAVMYTCAVYRMHIVSTIGNPAVWSFACRGASKNALAKVTLWAYNTLRNREDSYIITVASAERHALREKCMSDE